MKPANEEPHQQDDKNSPEKQTKDSASEKHEDKSLSSPRTHTEENKHCHVLGEGGETGHIIPGKSVVFASLEVCLCVLVRHIPALNPAIPQTGFQQPYKGGAFTDDVNNLITTCLQVMAQLPNLCSPKGKTQ